MALVLGVLGAAAGCGSGSAGDRSSASDAHRPPSTIELTPGHYTFHLGGRVRVGDRISCVTRSGAPAGGSGVPEPGHGVGSSTGYTITVSVAGVVKVTCPAHPGNV